MFHFRPLVGDEDLAEGVEELDGAGWYSSEFAGVVVELDECENVLGVGFEIGITVLEFYDE